MIFPNKWKNPNTTMFFGMVFLSLALVSQRFVHLSAVLGPGWTDGLRGLLFGISIGMNLWSVRLGARQRRCGASSS